jgi:hypothetical protein
MEFLSLKQKIAEAGKDSIKNRNVQLFGTDNFRSWMLYFEPGDDTAMREKCMRAPNRSQGQRLR